MRFGTWNIRSLYRLGSLTTVVRELGKCKLDLVGVQNVIWKKGGTEQAEDYTSFHGQENGDHQLGTGFFVHKRIVSAVRGVEFISDRMSYIILRGRWSSVVFKVHAPFEDKWVDVKDSFYEEIGRVFDQFTMYDTKILFGDFNAKVSRENIFKLTIGNERLHDLNKDNGFRAVKFASSKNLIVRSTMFPHRGIHKYTWTSPEENTHPD
jgi:hypothetical protein